jgi:hypothetical protein
MRTFGVVPSGRLDGRYEAPEPVRVTHLMVSRERFSPSLATAHSRDLCSALPLSASPIVCPHRQF